MSIAFFHELTKDNDNFISFTSDDGQKRVGLRFFIEEQFTVSTFVRETENRWMFTNQVWPNGWVSFSEENLHTALGWLLKKD